MKRVIYLLFCVFIHSLLLRANAQTTYEKCFKSCKNDPRVGARVSWIIDRAAGTVTIRATLSKSFVDNTYGANAVGWPAGNHKFNHLVTSDALQLALFDAGNAKVLEFRMDYLGENSSRPSGYGTTGITGKDGAIILGNPSNVLKVRTSLDENFNTYGYVLTANSPATDASYIDNPTYPNWIWDVWYEATVKLSAFGASGFGTVNIPYLHASPAKSGNDTECLTADANCPPGNNLVLGNMVWNDINQNGLKDSNEPGVGGVTVKLYRDKNGDNVPDISTPIATTTTNVLGYYVFSNLQAGKYITGVAIPAGYIAGPVTTTSSNPDNDIDNDNNGVKNTNGELRSNFITLASGAEPAASIDADGTNGNLTLDLALSGQGIIGDFVWNDSNNNGMQDGNETGLANVIITATFPDGTTRTTTTDNTGKYKFLNLGPVTYTIAFATPPGYAAALSIQGNDRTKDSDPVNGKVTVTLSPAETNLSIDAGFVNNTVNLGNHVWNDWNGNGVKNAGEPGVGGVTVHLYKDFNGDNKPDGSPVSSTTTTVDGYYYFRNLAPGKYIVGILIPYGYTITGTSFANPDNDIDNDNNGVTVINQSELRTNFITLAPGTEPAGSSDGSNSNFTLDIAICGRSNIGDFIWNDQNANGIQDAGEPALSNVAVTLTYPEGTTRSVTSDANGFYKFINLGPGSHTVSFSTPAGYSPSLSKQGTDRAKDSDPEDGSIVVNVQAVVDDYSIDAGFVPPGIITLGNTVWNDWNNNGMKDANEHGVEGVHIRLYRDNNGNNIPDGAAIATTFTDVNGKYSFNNLNNGRYIVGVAIPAGCTVAATGFSNPDDDKDNDNNAVNIVSLVELTTNYITLISGTEPSGGGNENHTLDMAIIGQGSIGDFVWNDVNANGLQDAGEPGIANLLITLTAPDGTFTTTRTDANGKYSFFNVATNTYNLAFSTPAGFNPSPLNQGNNDNIDSDPVNGHVFITLDPHENDLSVDAGFTQGNLLNLGNFVWNDFDGDGKKDANEPGIGGVQVKLYRDDISDNLPDGAAIATTTTNQQGYYSFTGLINGRYIASITVIAGYSPGGVTSSSANADNDVDGDNNAINRVGNELFTNAITLTAGTEPPDDGNDNNGNLTFDLALSGNSRIGDFIWEDVNGNGIHDVGEPGLNGVEVHLTQPDGTIRTVVSYNDAIKGAGYYDFSGVGPGTYTLAFITPPGYRPAPAIHGDDRAKDSNPVSGATTITLAADQSDFTIDAGFIPPGILTLGNLVWNDTNANGIKDADEPGIPGVTVRLYRDDNSDNTPEGIAIATTTTSVRGHYSFANLNNGRYIVDVIIPAGYTITPTHFDNPDNDVDNDNNGTYVIDETIVRSNAITLVAGAEPTNEGDDSNVNLTLDIALYGLATIGDFVWYDCNNNGIQGADENGLTNVRVTLTYEDGTTKTVKTDANGKYSFVNVGPGTYTLHFKTPLGYTPSSANQGSDNEKDSDPINETVTVTLNPAETNVTIDAGYWDDLDKDDDGITDTDESGGYYPFRDCDDDGVPNYMDASPGCPLPPGNDIYGTPYKPLTWIDCDGNLINDWFDFDKDGVINALDLDSDNDGITDMLETRDLRIVDLNMDGMVDGDDRDGDGLLSTADQNDNVCGAHGLIPQDLDRDGLPNYLDLDSDGDGITDLTESTGVLDSDGLANGTDTDGDGVRGDYTLKAVNADTYYGFGTRGVILMDNDGDGKPNAYDIDSDNDGITDNVEGQPTCSYKVPSANDTDNDGVDDAYDTMFGVCVPKSAGITPYDKDGDGTPDIFDLDTDNDGAPDVNEGSGRPGNFITDNADSDGDGLINEFDIFNLKTASGIFTNNVVHSEMGLNGNFDGPTPAGSNAGLRKSKPGGCAENTDRNWRDISLLPVTLLEFKGNLNNGVVKVNWKVTNEINMSNYVVERSTDGQTFKQVGNVKAAGTIEVTSYNFDDDVSSLFNTKLYYRLQQVDKNAATKQSNTIVFKLTASNEMTMSLFPNPATTYAGIKVVAAKESIATIRVMDVTGKTLISTKSKLAVGLNTITGIDINRIAAGTYNVQLITGDQIFNQKLVIAK